MKKEECLFCSAAAGTLEVLKVFENGTFTAFLDHRPLFPGHVLLIPNEHYETLTDLPEKLAGPLLSSVRKTARAVETAMEAHGTFIAMNNRVSQSVPHLHVHIVPRRFKDGLRGFFWPRRKISPDEMSEIREKIAFAYENKEA